MNAPAVDGSEIRTAPVEEPVVYLPLFTTGFYHVLYIPLVVVGGFLNHQQKWGSSFEKKMASFGYQTLKGMRYRISCFFAAGMFDTFQYLLYTRCVQHTIFSYCTKPECFWERFRRFPAKKRLKPRVPFLCFVSGWMRSFWALAIYTSWKVDG